MKLRRDFIKLLAATAQTGSALLAQAQQVGGLNMYSTAFKPSQQFMVEQHPGSRNEVQKCTSTMLTVRQALHDPVTRLGRA